MGLRTRAGREPNWHRSARRQRTKARTTLRILSEHTSSADIRRAIKALQGHHSGSTLCQIGQRELSRREVSGTTTARMSQAWRCSNCKIYCKAHAVFCGKCGRHWQQSAQQYWEAEATDTTRPSWKPHGQDGRTWSPRRQRPKSPRRPKGGGKDKGKGKGAETPQRPSPPDSSSLPAPPTRPAVPVPTIPAASKPNAAGAASADKLALDKVLTALQASESDLPPPLLELMQQFQEQDTKSEAKHLHKVVASQAAAKRELAKLRTSRTAYLQAWNTYVEQVMTTLQQQVTEHGTTMAEFQEKETQWEAALQDSTSTLAKMTQDGGVETVSDSDMESQENKVEAAIEAEAKARSAAERAQSQNQALIQAMEQVKTAAAEELKKDATDTNRERTPRRKAAATEPTQQNSGKAP